MATTTAGVASKLTVLVVNKITRMFSKCSDGSEAGTKTKANRVSQGDTAVEGAVVEKANERPKDTVMVAASATAEMAAVINKKPHNNHVEPEAAPGTASVAETPATVVPAELLPPALSPA